MDSADFSQILKTLRVHGQMHQQDQGQASMRQQLRGVSEQYESLCTTVNEQYENLTKAVQALTGSALPSFKTTPAVASNTAEALSELVPLPLASHAVFPHLSQPEQFTCKSGDCEAFQTQCDLHFELLFLAYPSDHAKIAYIISHLSRRDEAWTTAKWSRNSPICQSFRLFTKSFTQEFQHITPGREATRALVSQCQGRRRAADYAIEFWTLAAESG